MTDSVINIKNLTKNYETAAGVVPVLKGIDMTVSSGEFLAIMGASGSGKSTLMNILGCLDIPSGGIYELNGTDIKSLDKNSLASFRNSMIGFIFQGFNLLPRMSIIDNIALPLVYAGIPKEERIERACIMLEKVGLGLYGSYRPNQISGGQQQRVAIARALINRPKLILADEPTGNLDTKTSQEIMNLFSDLNMQEGITIILVTHENDIAQYAQSIVHIHDGKIDFSEPTNRMKESVK
ncbi:MAG: ABC transporter ATP-binding protein [Campylobacterales bacterium]|nr:ABC transporter ATP-binding protein [Campylobacterales bacterium]